MSDWVVLRSTDGPFEKPAKRPVERRVYVYTYMQDDGRVWSLSYLAHRTDRACVHRVMATSGAEAKKLAMREHKACIPNGVWKATHPDGHHGGTPCHCAPTFVPPGKIDAAGGVS